MKRYYCDLCKNELVVQSASIMGNGIGLYYQTHGAGMVKLVTPDHELAKVHICARCTRDLYVSIKDHPDIDKGK